MYDTILIRFLIFNMRYVMSKYDQLFSTTETQLIPISSLEFNEGQIEGIPSNPRNISNEQFERLVNSILDDSEFLNYKTLMVYPHEDKYIVLCGNMRLKAMQHLKYEVVPCMVFSHDIPIEKLKKWAIKDNVSMGEWDWKKLVTDFNVDELLEWGIDVPEEFDTSDVNVECVPLAEDDVLPENEIKPKSRLGDVFICGQHKIMCGDATSQEDVARLMGSERADIVWTDPPYNVAVNGVAGSILNDDMNTSDFRSFLSKVYKNYFSFMREGAVIYVAHSESERVSFTDEFLKAGFKLSLVRIWIKQSGVMTRQDYNYAHEPILYGWKEGAAHYFCKDFTATTIIDFNKPLDEDYKRMSKDQLVKEIRRLINDRQEFSSVLHYDRPLISELHPTMKPVGLVELCLKQNSLPDNIVLDLFGGSGTTLIAAHKLKRKARIMELSPAYCDVILRRFSEYANIEPIRESDNVKWSDITSEE